MADNSKKGIALIEQGLALLKKSADTAVKMPAPDDVDELEKTDVAAIAEAFSIGIEGMKPIGVKALVKLAAQIVEGAEDAEFDKDELSELCEAVGVQPKKKVEATVEALKAYFDSVQDTEDGATETEAEGGEEEDTGEGDTEETQPKGKKGAKAAKEEDSDTEDTGEGETESDTNEDASESEEEEVSDKEKKKRVDAFNKIAKNKVKDYAALKKLLVGNDGEVAEWGVPYVKGEEENAVAYCCGLKLKDIPHPTKKAKKGEDPIEAGQCKITGKIFEQNDDGELVELEVESED